MTGPTKAIVCRLLALAIAAGFCLQTSIGAAFAQTDAPRLTGHVTSSEEGAMEGVLVSAQQAGSPITVTVVSDQPAASVFRPPSFGRGTTRCASARSATSLDRPQAVDLAAAQATTIDLKLRKTADLAAQLTNTEWFMSMPGTAEQKRPLIECMSCHTLERIVRSKFTRRRVRPRAQAHGATTPTTRPGAGAATRRRARRARRARAQGRATIWRPSI